MSIVALLTVMAGFLSLVCLLALHLMSPEFKPSWRMVSEYANGQHKWILTLFFLLWGICSILCAALLWNQVSSIWASIGVVLVFITGIGAIFGGLFDVNHKLHGVAFGLGVPFLPIGALLVSYHLVKLSSWNEHQSQLLISAHAIWISLVLMAFSMMLLFSGFKKAAIPFGPNIAPPEALPPGVIGINGYMNRILIIVYILWCVFIAKIYLTF